MYKISIRDYCLSCYVVPLKSIPSLLSPFSVNRSSQTIMAGELYKPIIVISYSMYRDIDNV